MNQPNPTPHGTAALHGYGRIPFIDLTTALTEHMTAWADYHGFHIGPPPGHAPPYTHLWAWAPGWRLRARIDAGTAIVAVLDLGTTPLPGPPLTTNTISYTVEESATWNPDRDQQVGPLAATVARQFVQLHHVHGEHCLQFIAVHPRTHP